MKFPDSKKFKGFLYIQNTLYTLPPTSFVTESIKNVKISTGLKTIPMIINAIRKESHLVAIQN